MNVSFDDFVDSAGRRLRAGLVAAYGPDVGADASAEALAYGWEHWERVSSMTNPAGYLYRVGQTAARKWRRKQGFLPQPRTGELPHVEPGLASALEALTEVQRTVVLLVHAFDWSQAETAELLDVSPSTVRTHLRRGLGKLRDSLEVDLSV